MIKRQSLSYDGVISFRKIGRILMLPLAALLLAGLLMSAGDLLGRSGFTAAAVLTSGGFVLIDLFPLLIAVSLAAGLSGAPAGSTALAAAAAWLVLDKSGTVLYDLLNAGQTDVASFDAGLAGGVLAGLLSGFVSNRCQKIVLPRYLVYFSAQPLTLLLSALAALPAGLLCGSIWSTLQAILTTVAIRLTAGGAGGAFIYGFLNRLLLPLGLHHALNQQIWLRFGDFTSQSGVLIQGDMSRFFAGDPAAGRYTAGFFPIMIFAVPAMAACFYLTSRRANRARMLPVLIIAGLVSLLSGVTEPLEFLILFTSPLLYLIYALLSGLSQLLCFQLQIHEGFNFSAGLTDYLANWHTATHPAQIWQVGILMAALSFAVFYLAIVLLKLYSPGRETESELVRNPTEPIIAPAETDHDDQAV